MECQLEKISLHYTSYGDGHPMILLHGFGLDHRLMTGCLEPLLQPHGGWKRMCLDLPGMGKTPGKEWLTSSDQMLDVVISVGRMVSSATVMRGEFWRTIRGRPLLSWIAPVITCKSSKSVSSMRSSVTGLSAWRSSWRRELNGVEEFEEPFFAVRGWGGLRRWGFALRSNLAAGEDNTWARCPVSVHARRPTFLLFSY